jgi:hypothetical protein
VDLKCLFERRRCDYDIWLRSCAWSAFLLPGCFFPLVEQAIHKMLSFPFDAVQYIPF